MYSLLTRCVCSSTTNSTTTNSTVVIPCSGLALALVVVDAFRCRIISSQSVRDTLRLLESTLSPNTNNSKSSSSSSCNSNRSSGVLMARTGISHIIKMTNNQGLVYEKVQLDQLQRDWRRTMNSGTSGTGDRVVTSDDRSDAAMALMEYYIDAYTDGGYYPTNTINSNNNNNNNNNSSSSSSSSKISSVFAQPCLFRVLELSKVNCVASSLKDYVQLIESSLQDDTYNWKYRSVLGWLLGVLCSVPKYRSKRDSITNSSSSEGSASATSFSSSASNSGAGGAGGGGGGNTPLLIQSLELIRSGALSDVSGSR